MAFEPSTKFKTGQEFVTSYDRKYTVLGGPWGDNAAVWYVVKDGNDGLVRLITERALEGMDGRKTE